MNGRKKRLNQKSESIVGYTDKTMMPKTYTYKDGNGATKGIDTKFKSLMNGRKILLDQEINPSLC